MYIIIEYMKQTICIYAFAALLLGGCKSNNELTIPTNLRTEYLTEPIGLDTSSPRFTWEYSGNEEGFKASRYEVRIGTSPDDLRPYAEGMALKPHTRYYWNVTVWDGEGRPCATSETASFETAKFDPSDWSASWITDHKDKEFEPAPLFRKSFPVGKEVKDARVYVASAGYHELFINGERVGTNYLDPGYTHFDKRILYVTHDVTSLLKQGDNAVAAVLGNGWYNEQSVAVWNFHEARWRDRPRLLCELRITYTDGTTEVIGSDETWKTSTGAYTYNNIYSGDKFDARLEEAGWKTAHFDDSKWEAALPAQAPAPLLVAQQMPGIRITEEVRPVSMKRFSDQLYVYSFPKNMSGLCRLKVKGEAGTRITLKHGELLKKDGRLEQGNINVYYHPVKPDEVFQMDVFTLKGTGEEEIFMPSFSYHGFQYVEVESSRPVTLTEENLTGLFMHTDVRPSGSFACSNPLLNKIWEATMQAYRSNLHSIPTDCPQRDERMGWTGDAQVFARTATYNMNVDPFYTRWLYSVRDNQGDDGSYANYIPVVGFPPHGAEDGGGAMGWMEAGVIVPWQMYQQYGDVRILEQHYASMVAYMDYLERRAVRYVQPFGGFGDWLAIEPTNSMLTNTAYSAYDALIMEQVAKRLGKDADQRRFRTFYENVKRSFNDLFVNEEGRTFAPTVESIFGKDSQVGMWPGTAATEAKIVDTQTSYVVPLQFDLFNEKNKPLAIRHLVENIKKHNYTLTTGFIGTPYLNLVLSDNGYDDVAYKLFEQTAYPSWLYPVLQGATTIWERWNSYTLVNGFGPVDMNSFNHYSYGAIEEWMIAYTLGIQRDEEQPAYKHIILQPRIGGTFSFIRGHYDSAYGRIESGWQIQKKGYIYEATIPANTTATLYLPAKSEKSVRMEKGQEGITPVGLKDGKAVYRLGSGSYRIYVD